jgi:hypothetical protein
VNTRPHILILAAAANAVLCNPCAGQAEPTPVTTEEKLPTPGHDLTFSVFAGYQHIFNTDLELTGDFTVDRTGLHLQARGAATQNVRLEANFRYLFDDYEFTGATVLDPIAGDAWQDVHTLAVDAMVEWWVTNNAAILVGPTLQFSRESGADWTKSVTGGGRFGAMFVTNKTLVWGFGLGISSQLDDSVLVYPFIVLNWQLNGQARLLSVCGPVGLATTGVEFAYDLGGGFETGVGFRYEYRRFRLDDADFAPGGVGEDTSIPFWGRISYRFTPNLSADLYAGLVFSQKFKVDDLNGVPLSREKGDPAPTMSLAIRFKF